jgi:Na+-transporting NADH:ubiquinone oxidoreductase subunit NqrB
MAVIRSQLRDPRLFQIATLTCLLVYGIADLDFEIRPRVVLAIIATALGVQFVLTVLCRRPGLELRSALVSTLSLCLLLRTTSEEVAAAAAAAAIASKFVLRIRTKHVFNPTALGLAAVLATADNAWVSAGQWGTAPLAGLWIAGFGSLVIRRAHRSDITWAFLACYLVLLFGRSWWLGDPIAIGLHHISSGAFLIFAFFMISDPRTTPDTRAGRILFAGIVAATALTLRFGFYQTNALLWSLLACAPLVPLLDRWLPAERYQWPSGQPTPRNDSRIDGGTRDETTDDMGAVLPGLSAAS